ncbi:MAG: DUF1697 domain-containing protein [Acidimicrobiia bacterium]|nr:DUF1697 domain-containing protein [Acidimicrobiia bacterium]
MRHVAFIRAVMIGRESLHREIVLDLFAAAGAGDPKSHLATGNVSFDLDLAALPDLVEEVDDRMTQVVGRRIDSYVRTLDELRAIDADIIFGQSPFPDSPCPQVTFFHEPPDLSQWILPHLGRGGRFAVFHVEGREVYSVTREVDGESAAPGGQLEKVTGQRATTRAWSTIDHILSKH